MTFRSVLVQSTIPLLLLVRSGTAQVVESPESTLEFIGLERWTVTMIRDTMAVKAPGEPLAACAAILASVGFPSASVHHYAGPTGKPYIAVTLVEPHRSDRIRLRSSFPDSLSNRVAWREGLEIFESDNEAFQTAVSTSSVRRDTAFSRSILVGNPGSAEGIRRYWSFLDAHATATDRDDAIWTLANDRNRYNRVLAASLLANFGDSDRAWQALVDAQRDSLAFVAATATQALQSLVRAEARPVDWTPILPAIRALLEGTNVFVYHGVVSTLLASEIAPSHAPVLLSSGGGDLLLSHLRSIHPELRGGAHRLLVLLAGRDLGESEEAWRAWMKSLPG